MEGPGCSGSTVGKRNEILLGDRGEDIPFGVTFHLSGLYGFPFENLHVPETICLVLAGALRKYRRFARQQRETPRPTYCTRSTARVKEGKQPRIDLSPAYRGSNSMDWVLCTP